MKIVSWNVNGIRASHKKGLADYIINEEPDILCLQEVKAHKEQCEPDIQNLGYSFDTWSSAIRKGYSGVATFSLDAPKSSRTISAEIYDQEGRVVISEFEKFTLYNIYFPNGGSGDARHDFKQKFLYFLNDHLRAEIKAGKSLIVVGDYNVAHKEIDVYDPVRLSKISGFLPEERVWFDKFLELGFVDTFRHFHPDAKDRYSWWSYREMARVSNRGWRIDYICVTKDLLPFVKSADVQDGVEGSDHCPVIIELEF